MFDGFKEKYPELPKPQKSYKLTDKTLEDALKLEYGDWIDSNELIYVLAKELKELKTVMQKEIIYLKDRLK